MRKIKKLQEEQFEREQDKIRRDAIEANLRK